MRRSDTTGGRLHVFVTADPELQVPPRLYGGIERIIALLVEGLLARGHRVTLFAHPASEPPCDLVPYRGLSSRRVRDSLANASLIGREVRRRRPDLIQSFGRLAYLWPVLGRAIPKVMSYQRAITPRSVRLAARLAGDTIHFTGCSRHLVTPVAQYGSWTVIYNGVAVDRLQARADVPPDAPLVFLGRIEEIKGTHLAIEVACRSGRRLVIAGNVAPEHRGYFEQRVAPSVDGTSVRYVGEVDDVAKSRLLSTASALLMPILWDEPFGIVMAEALACGTPVIAMRRGAVPEVVDEGRTGFVCDNADDMVAAVARLGDIDRRACRRAAETRFSQDALVSAYERLYSALTSSRAA